MLDLLRRFLAVAIVLTAFVALMPLVPLVFGYSMASVSGDLGGTVAPATATAPSRATGFIFCESMPAAIAFRRNASVSGAYFRCENNWANDVDITISVDQQNLTGLTATGAGLQQRVPRGQYRCFTATVGVGGTNRVNRTTVLKAVVSTLATSNDLTATLYFPMTVTVRTNGTNTAATCT